MTTVDGAEYALAAASIEPAHAGLGSDRHSSCCDSSVPILGRLLSESVFIIFIQVVSGNWSSSQPDKFNLTFLSSGPWSLFFSTC